MTATPDLAGLHAELVEKVAEGAERLGVPGVAVGIMAGDREDYVFHGVTSVTNPLEVDSDTLFQIGSTTKTYTGTVMMMLVERGLVSLDDPVRKHLPELRLKDESVAQRVTILNLLNHTAGWVGDTSEDVGEGDDALEKFAARLADVEQLSPLNTVAAYNNAALNLAGLVIQRVAGMTYEAAVKEMLLDPVGLDDSLFFPTDIMVRRFAVGHREVDGRVSITRPWALPRAGHPAGGIAATAADQLKYARFHLGDGTGKDGAPVLSRQTLQLMREPTFPLHGGPLGDHVGITWFLRDLEGGRTVGHGGAMNGQMSSFDMVPERDFAVTVLTNADKGGQLHQELTTWVLEAYLNIVEAEPEPLELAAEELGAFAGRYDSRTAIIDITVEGDHLLLTVTYTEEGRKMVHDLIGTDPPELPPLPARILPGDLYLVDEGEYKGMKGNIVRGDDGAVSALNVGGRLAYRVS